MYNHKVIWRNTNIKDELPDSTMIVICEIDEIEPHIYSTKQIDIEAHTTDCMLNSFTVHFYIRSDNRKDLHQLWRNLIVGDLYLAIGPFYFHNEPPYITLMDPTLLKLDRKFVQDNPIYRPEQVNEFSMKIDE